jgi:exopolysaccharide biosynthesis polyprenyl glycosylphosphotransferase
MVLFVAVTQCRWAAYAAVLALRRRGLLFRPTVMVGSYAGAAGLARRIQAHPEAGLRLVGLLADNGRRCHSEEVPLLGPVRELDRIVKTHHVTNLIIGYGGMTSTDLVDVLRRADRADLEIHVVPRLFELSTRRGSDDHIWGLPLMCLRSPADRRLTRPVKRITDIVLAVVALVLAFPVMVAVAIAVRGELGPGIFFTQTRIGAHGAPFQMVKFRSMPATVSGHGTRWTVDSNLVGPVGRFIRRFSLDELPQLWNVVKGDMSIVGPRPERPEFVAQFIAVYPLYAHRHRVSPGLTGLAAVNGLRGDTSIEERANFDNWYIENWSLWLDAKIMVRTVSALLRGTGG